MSRLGLDTLAVTKRAEAEASAAKRARTTAMTWGNDDVDEDSMHDVDGAKHPKGALSTTEGNEGPDDTAQSLPMVRKKKDRSYRGSRVETPSNPGRSSSLQI